MGLLVDDEDTALMWRGLILAKALEQFLVDVSWGDLDYLLIDMPPGTGDIQMALSRLLPQTEMLVVTTPAVGAQKVAARVADMARRSYLKVLGVVENMTEFVAPDGSRHAIFGSGGGKRLAALTGAPLVGSVPIEPAVSSDGDAGTPVVLAHPDAPAALRAEHDRGADRHRAPAAGRDGGLHGAHVRARPKAWREREGSRSSGSSTRVLGGGGHRAGVGSTSAARRRTQLRRTPVPQGAARVLGRRTPTRCACSLAVQDAVFVAGVVHMVERAARAATPTISGGSRPRSCAGACSASPTDARRRRRARGTRGGRRHRATRAACSSRISSARGGSGWQARRR